MLKTYLTVMLGGALGSALRMWFAGAVSARYGESFPFGTIVVNVLGSFAIGAFVGFTSPGAAWSVSPLTRQFVIVGILGGFTTFSAFSLQTYSLIETGQWGRGSLNVVVSVATCLMAVWLGHLVAAPFRQS